MCENVCHLFLKHNNMAKRNFILENDVFDEGLEGVQTFTLKQVSDKQRELKLQGTSTHIRIYSDAQIHAYTN